MREGPLDAAGLRAVAGNYATGIAVVSTHLEGVHHAMTANSFTTVSLEPLLVSVCVQHGTGFHAAITASRAWTASFLRDSQAGLAAWFATRGRPLAEQFAGIPTQVAGNGCLVLAGSLGAISATTWATVPAGDHDIIVGLVVGLHHDDSDAAPAGNPTVYFRSTYGSWLRPEPDGPTINR